MYSDVHPLHPSVMPHDEDEGESSSTPPQPEAASGTAAAPGTPNRSSSNQNQNQNHSNPNSNPNNNPNNSNLDGCFVNTPVKTVKVVLPERCKSTLDGSSNRSRTMSCGSGSSMNGTGNNTNNTNTKHSRTRNAADAHRAAAAEIDSQARKNEERETQQQLQPLQQQKQQLLQKSSKQLQRKKTQSLNPVIPDAIDFGTAAGSIAMEQEQSTADQSNGKILLGICAMDKKARSKPMAEILSRLDDSIFRVVFFGDDLILNKPVQEWPANIDVLIAFYSKGYPLQKAKEYVKLRDPVCLNDLDMQERLQDRRMVYDLLEASGIDVPRHVFLSQDGYRSTGTGDGNKQGETTVREFDDHIEINGVSIHKPFVEKPVDADDHNIAIYYPTSAGGGCKKLFRKIGNRSSEFYPDIHEIRRDGSYVYEEFVETQGTDVKMYTVGPDYGHAEARKSPTVDGKVQRNADGKELRFPVILTLGEKEIARRIVLQFKQFVCGFDLLRVQEGHSIVSYCCDVNGFSFVKNSRKYYDDCAQILTEHMLAIMKPEEHNQFSTLEPLVTEVADVVHGGMVEGFMTTMNPLSRVARLLRPDPGNSGTNSTAASTTTTTTTTNTGNNNHSNHSANHGDGTSQSHADTVVSDENIETRSHKSMLSTDDPTLLEEGAVPVRQIPRELLSEPASLPASRNASCEDLFGKYGGGKESDDELKEEEEDGQEFDNDGDDDISAPTQRHDNYTNHLSHQNSERSSSSFASSSNNLRSSNPHGGSTMSLEGLGNSKNSCSRSSLVNMHQEELRCVIAVVRHADRTPKEKLKLNTVEPIILQYFRDHSDSKKPTKDLKIKDKTSMQAFLQAVRTIIAKYETKQREGDGDLCKDDEKIMWKFKHMRDVLERWKFSGLTRKLQLKPKTIDIDPVTGAKTVVKEVQLILKWGGDLTKLGENQAIQLGQQFRHSIYPDSPGGGVLRLHSTFRHDLKIKTSDEGRVMKTAAAFAKGLLDLEGDIPPILVSLVHKEKGSMHMLDPSGDKDVKLELDECKEKISQHLQEDIDWNNMTEEDRIRLVGPPEVRSLRDALAKIGNPRKTLQTIYETMGTLIEELEEMLGNMESGDEKTAEDEGDIQKGDSEDADAQLSGVKLYKGETLLELTERWRFIYKRMYEKETDTFDLSRIPDVLDNVRFDVLHNPHLGLTYILHKLYRLAKDMADTVVPQEYGTTLAEKRSVGIKVCSSLLEKIRFDLHIARTDNKTDMRYMINMDYSADLPINTMGRRIRTRLYFTSESHLHTLINVLRFAATTGNSCPGNRCSSPVLSPYGMDVLNESKEVCYLTQVVIRLFEDTGRRMSDPRRYRVEILFSAGATGTPIHQCKSTKEADSTRLDTDPLVAVGRDGLTCEEVEEFFDSIIAERGQSDGKYSVEAISDPGVASSSKPPTPRPVAAAAPVTTKPLARAVSEQSEALVSGGNAAPERTSVGFKTAKDTTIQNGSAATDGSSSSGDKDKAKKKPALSGTEDNGNKITATEEKSSPALSPSPALSELHASSAESAGKKVADPKKSTDPESEEDRDRDHDQMVRNHKYLYLTIATTAMALGVGCLVLAMGVTGPPRNRRHFSRR